jgi:hypothetical protein
MKIFLDHIKVVAAMNLASSNPSHTVSYINQTIFSLLYISFFTLRMPVNFSVMKSNKLLRYSSGTEDKSNGSTNGISFISILHNSFQALVMEIQSSMNSLNQDILFIHSFN